MWGLGQFVIEPLLITVMTPPPPTNNKIFTIKRGRVVVYALLFYEGETFRQSGHYNWSCQVTFPKRIKHSKQNFPSGIGYESTLAFLREDANVIMADINVEAGQKALASIKATLPSSNVLFLQCDVSSPSSVANLISKSEEHFGQINVLFNNAGIMHNEDGGITETNDDIWNLTMKINTMGVAYCCRYGIPALRRAGGGSIINTASFVARLGAATSQIACMMDFLLSFSYNFI